MEPQQVPGGEAVSLPPYLVIAHRGHNILRCPPSFACRWSFLLLPVPARKPPPMGPGGGFGRDGAAPFGLSALLRPLVVPLAVVG